MRVLTDGDDNNVECEQNESCDQAKKREANHVKNCAESHHQEGWLVFDGARQPELKKDDSDGAGAHQKAITLRVDAVVIPQIN